MDATNFRMHRDANGVPCISTGLMVTGGGWSRAAVLASASLIALAALDAPDAARAACSGADQTITTTVTGPIVSNGGAIAVLGGAVVNGAPQGVYAPSCSISNLGNGGRIAGANGAGGSGVANLTAITTLTNSGTISGGFGGGAGVSNAINATIGLLSNVKGEISGGVFRGAAGVSNAGVITELSNGAKILGGSGGTSAVPAGAGGAGLLNSGIIAALNNGGTISAALGFTGGAGVSNSRTITTLTNTGIVRGGVAEGTRESGGAGISNAGAITTLTNSGTIVGGFSYSGAAGAGLLNTGNIGLVSVANSGLHNSGQIEGFVNTGGAGGAGVLNAGTITSLTNSGRIDGGNGANVLGGAGGAGGAGVANSHAIGSSGVPGDGLYNSLSIRGGNGGNGGNATSAGAGPGAGGKGGAGLSNSGTITMLVNVGTLSGGNGGNGGSAASGGGGAAGAGAAGGAGGAGVANLAGGFVESLSNFTGGTISGGSGGNGGNGGNGGPHGSPGAVGAGVSNAGKITAISNDGTIRGGAGAATGGVGVLNAAEGATIGSLANGKLGTIVGGFGRTGAGGDGVANLGDMTALDNLGGITGGRGGLLAGAGGAGVANSLAIGTLTNSGTIEGGEGGEFLGRGGIGVANLGGFLHPGTIGSLINEKGGVISGGSGTSGGTGLYNSGRIDSLINHGVIRDPGYAIYSTGSIGPITNSGQIIGNVEIDQSKAVVTGGPGKSFGTWSGGTITIGGDLKFAGGNTDLGDNILVDDGTGTVTNVGVLRPAGRETIFGNFDQGEGGALDFALAGDSFGQYGALKVTGSATLFGELALDLVNGFRLSAGDSFDLMTFGTDSNGFSGVSVDGAPCSATLSGTWLCPGAGLYLDVAIGTKGVDLTTAAIPEPSSWALLATGFLGLAGLGLRRRGRRQRPEGRTLGLDAAFADRNAGIIGAINPGE